MYSPLQRGLVGGGVCKGGCAEGMFLPRLDLSLCLYAPPSSCRWMESYSTPSKGETQRCPCSWKGRGSCILQGRAQDGGSFPEMWQLGKRQEVWRLCDAGTFALGRWPGDKQTTREGQGRVTRHRPPGQGRAAEGAS